MDQGEQFYRLYLGGDDDGLVQLIDRYKYPLSLYLETVTGHAILAEDAMEETFVKLAVRRPRFWGGSSFKTWLFAIGRHTALDLLRSQQRRKMLPIDEVPEAEDEQNDLERQVIRDESRLELYHAMDLLRSDYRQILYLSYFEEMDNAELGKVLGLGKRQVENRLSRARIALRRILEREGFSYEEY